MIRLALPVLTLLLALPAARPAVAQTAADRGGAPAATSPQDLGVEVSEVVVTARRPGRDPSHASTECIWAQLPADQRDGLTRVAETAVRILANHDDLPLTSPALTNDAVGAASSPAGVRARTSTCPLSASDWRRTPRSRPISRRSPATGCPRPGSCTAGICCPTRNAM